MNKISLRFFLTIAVGLTLVFGVSNALANQQNKFIANGFLGAWNEPTIITDKYSYDSGEIVVLTGSGYGKFEQVTVNIESRSNLTGQNVVLGQFTVYANFRGQFSTEVSFDSLASESGTFTVKAFGSGGKTMAETVFIAAPEAIGVDIEQCANGTLSSPIPCNVAMGNDGYTRGNLTPTKSHYVEGQSVPIRVIATGLTVNQQYTVTIGYDFTKAGKYAVDYLTDFDRTEILNNNPCVGVTGLTCVDADMNGTPEPNDVFPIPTDPEVTNGFNQMPGGGDDIVQIGGDFAIFGGDITSVSGYTRSGLVTGDSSKTITITFTALNSSVVIAYGSHIAERIDWGNGNSAISISGSPYHNFVAAFPGANSGNRDLQFGADAVTYKAIVRIIKDAVPNAPDDFFFTVSGPGSASVTLPGQNATGPLTFTLDDDTGAIGGDDPTFTNNQLVDNVILFGAGNEIYVNEANAPGWMLSPSSFCTESSGAPGFPSVMDSTFEQGNRRFVIRAQEGEIITCTFINEVVLAAGASIDGTIRDSFGRGIGNVLVRVTDVETGQTTLAITNPFGTYSISDLQVGGNYIVRVSSKRYAFTPDSRIITLNEDAVGVDFIANPE